jgi:hypothetical protein
MAETNSKERMVVFEILKQILAKDCTTTNCKVVSSNAVYVSKRKSRTVYHALYLPIAISW